MLERPIIAYSSLFHSIPASSSLFHLIPTNSTLFPQSPIFNPQSLIPNLQSPISNLQFGMPNCAFYLQLGILFVSSPLLLYGAEMNRSTLQCKKVQKTTINSQIHYTVCSKSLGTYGHQCPSQYSAG